MTIQTRGERYGDDGSTISRGWVSIGPSGQLVTIPRFAHYSAGPLRSGLLNEAKGIFVSLKEDTSSAKVFVIQNLPLILALTAVSLLFSPYRFGAGGDHLLYLNYAQKLLDPSLYPNDFLFSDNAQLNAEFVTRIQVSLSSLFGSLQLGYYLTYVAAILLRVVGYVLLGSLFLKETGLNHRSGAPYFSRLALLLILVVLFSFFAFDAIWDFTPKTEVVSFV